MENNASMDRDALAKLPSRFALKADNKKFLKAVTQGGLPCLEFTSTDPNDGYSAHEAISRPNGYYLIKSEFHGKFWRRTSDDWILADTSDDGGKDRDTLFSAVKVDDTRITLHNVGNGKSCGRLTAKDKTDCLIAPGEHHIFEVMDLS